MASGQQLARLFQRSCLLFNQNASKLSAGRQSWYNETIYSTCVKTQSYCCPYIFHKHCLKRPSPFLYSLNFIFSIKFSLQMRYLIVRCHYQLVNRTSKYFLPHIVKGEGLETSQFVFYSPLLGNLNTISLNLKIKSAVAYSRSSTIDF